MTWGARAVVAIVMPLSVGTIACRPDPAVDDGAACSTVVWGAPRRAGEALAVVGSWDGWSQSTALRAFPDDPAWQFATLDLAPGEYGYLLVEEGRGALDRFNALSTFRDSDEQEVSLLLVADCSAPQLQVAAVNRVDAHAVDVTLQVTRARTDAPLDPTTIVADFDGIASVQSADPNTDTAVLRLTPVAPGKHTATVVLDDVDGVTVEPVQVATWSEPVAEQWNDGIVYQVVIDRFRGRDGVSLEAPPSPGARAGGTLDGVTSALRNGDFAALGVSALWLSPVYTNPTEARLGRDDDYEYEGYHGYWPLDSRGVDARIGGEAALHELVAQAHAAGIAVLLDLVPNHLYEANPRVAQGRAEGWFHEHEPPCVCGTPSCPWGTFIRTCWFTDYLPDLRFENADVMQTAVADALWWQREFDTDGFRIDAVPMMPRAATRRIAHALRTAVAPRSAVFTIGEVFTGPGTAGTDDLRYYLGPDGLDSAFDFPLMWALRSAVAGPGGFAAVEQSLAYTDVALAGSGAELQLGRMVGNHDVTRFASELAGNASADAWTEPPAQPTDPALYERQRLALGLVLTLPGLPVIYYGDEVGLAGAADPDNRRVLPDEVALSDAQWSLRDDVRRLGRLRRCLPALRGGARTGLLAGQDSFAFVRDAGDGAPALVVAMNADTATDVELPSSAGLLAGSYVDVLSDTTLQVGAPPVVVAMPPRGLAVFIPAGHPCGVQ